MGEGNFRDNLGAFDHPVFEHKKMLKARAISAFDCQCSYCGEVGDPCRGPDSRPWHLDRIVPGILGGEYVADNVTLACAGCNLQKNGSPGGRGTDWDANSLEAEEWHDEWERHQEAKDIDRVQSFNRMIDGCNPPANENILPVECH